MYGLCLSLGPERAVEIAGSRAPVDEEVGAGNERALAAHQKLGDVRHLVGSSRASRWTFRKHVFVEAAVSTYLTRSAASVKLPVSTTAAKYCICLSSIASPPSVCAWIISCTPGPFQAAGLARSVRILYNLAHEKDSYIFCPRRSAAVDSLLREAQRRIARTRIHHTRIHARAEATPSPTPEPPEDEYFTISMVGDCTLSSSQREDYFETVVNGDMSWPFSGTKQYFEDDYLTIANLECSLSHEMLYGSATFTFCGDAENAEMLVQGGVDFVTIDIRIDDGLRPDRP